MRRILVVDDDPMVCMAIEIYLERQGLLVTIADGGVTGLRALAFRRKQDES
jgi:CheY-like chemotaxis protein